MLSLHGLVCMSHGLVCDLIDVCVLCRMGLKMFFPTLKGRLAPIRLAVSSHGFATTLATQAYTTTHLRGSGTGTTNSAQLALSCALSRCVSFAICVGTIMLDVPSVFLLQAGVTLLVRLGPGGEGNAPKM